MKTEKFDIVLIIVTVLMLIALATAAHAQQTKFSDEPQFSGGAFTISKTVIAGGGGEIQNQSRGIQNTAGQTIAGGTSTGGAFSLKSGFWMPEDFAPTAAAVTVGGRVVTPLELGLTNAMVTLTNSNGESRTTRTGKSGSFRFTDVIAGETYMLSVISKRYTYTPQVITVTEDLTELNFIPNQ